MCFCPEATLSLAIPPLFHHLGHYTIPSLLLSMEIQSNTTTGVSKGQHSLTQSPPTTFHRSSPTLGGILRKSLKVDYINGNGHQEYTGCSE